MKQRGRGMNWLEKKKERGLNEGSAELNEVIEKMVFRNNFEVECEEEEKNK